MLAKKKQNNISRQLEEIQTLLKQKDSKPLNFIEAAQYLSISHSTLYKLSYQKKIRSYKPAGKLLYFFKNDLDTWITSKDEMKKHGEDVSTKLKHGKHKKEKLNIEINEKDTEEEPP